MSQSTIEMIIKQIDALSDADRQRFDSRLAKIDEKRWRQEAAKARKVARKMGIDQADIDRKIERLRYH